MKDGKKMRIIRLLGLTVLLGLVVFIPVHFWLTDRSGVMRAVFPLQSVLAKASSSCSPDAPDWLGTLAFNGVDTLKALSTQVAVVDAAGRVHHCETGWKGTMLLSETVSRDSRFRYGSLTKPVTAAAVLAKVKDEQFSLGSSLAELMLEPQEWAKAEDTRLAGITVEQLLAHRSGLGFAGSRHDVFSESSRPWCPYAMSELTDVVLPGNVDSARYSNIGYCILGELLSGHAVDYRSYMEDWLGLSVLGVGFAEAEPQVDEVTPDFRYNEVYNQYYHGDFDFFAISSTAGMTGSASAYAQLMRRILDMKLPRYLLKPEDKRECNPRILRNCYGLAFYLYLAKNGEAANVKGGFMPGFSGLVAINDREEVFVWLGNSDTENAASGIGMRAFLDQLMETAF